MDTFKIKVEGTQQQVDAYLNSLPFNAIESTSGTLPHRGAERVHKYVTLYSPYYLPEHGAIQHQSEH